MSFDRLVTLPGTLPEQMDALWARQAAEWPRLQQGLASLHSARIKSLDVHGSSLLVQSNAARIISTGAKIDPASIAARPCFLCPANLPVEQLGLAYGDKWLILSNPAPIFDPHFTINSIRHEPQRILPLIDVVLDLARDLAGAYTVFYNGPKCGASAPDHVHMQAIKTGVLPFELELLGELWAREGWIDWRRDHPVRVGLTNPPRRPAVVLAGADRAALKTTLEEIINLLGEVHPADPEPMLNLFAVYTPDLWLVYLFPRFAHRPACYGTGPGQFVVSPGSIDLGGVLIAPRPEDFDRLTSETAAGILDEVLLPPDRYAQLRAAL